MYVYMPSTIALYLTKADIYVNYGFVPSPREGTKFALQTHDAYIKLKTFNISTFQLICPANVKVWCWHMSYFEKKMFY